MGGIVICGGDEGHDLVIDGQQRLSTITLFIAACRDYLWKELATVSARTLAVGIHNDYIVSGGAVAEKNEPYLILGEIDRQWFGERVQVSPEKDGEYSPPDINKVPYKLPGSNRLLWRSYQFFYRQVQKRHAGSTSFATTDAKLEDIKCIIRELATKTWFVITRVPDDTQAYTLFEVLNDRGLELSISDLIKNVVLSRASQLQRLPKAKAHWADVVEALDYENVASFLRYLWMSQNGRKVTENDLFPILKQEIKGMSAPALIAYLKSVVEEAENYAEIIGRTDSSDDIARELELISAYGFRVGSTVLLAIWAKSQDEKGRLEVLREVKCFLVKYAIFANQVTNELETVMAEVAAAIRKNLSGGLAEMKARFKKALPSAQTIADGFKVLEPSTSVARALLVEMETKLAGTEKTVSNPSKVNVEHIFPQSPSDEWEKSFGANGAEESYMGRLGNLTLLDSKLNKQASNKLYPEKRRLYYSKSDLRITNSLPEGVKWTAAMVDDRQEELLKIARQIWRFA